MTEQPSNELITLRDLLRFAVSRFNEAKLYFGHGSDNAWDEAAYLLLHHLHLPLDRLEPFLDARLTSEERGSALRLIDRRVNERLPAAYLSKEAWLGVHRFYVDERVIVPRSFIAELLHERLAPWIDEPDEIGAVLDLCTGSGCLAIIAAHAFPAARVDAVDLSADALAIARRNVADYELGERIRLLQGDLFSGLGGRRYDLIIANPPYVGAAAMASLPAEYRHEPELALASGEDGLDLTRAILGGAQQHLQPAGLLVVEIGHNRDALEAAFPETPFTWLDTSAGDQYVFLLHRDELP
ncbi:50S ribosomal protein L3 N(5)-glutamine methyltransferase [Accumulibacter sp.]|uniref:50S ribosomal protein L3 N(5)-glutamine methyltransferase n=1 Tax=Accumulibacter sp. TaxID=2053492 RepID=UPI0025F206FE|nr:50S ribosomal protein L3 N(5)-glutamine methyltransferase [Accumulibacter sp.]MCM8613380.1 50S ribosomal protein L3 N(5)-glutamine methyltransferase [Accumulibacter sp.]MCM8637027.1 50S ribosomal protein L3 N(5)-glutamine methyltransferase [Accumulibacter sp.]MCM8638642.1 50S ribosomal protein L3 N(5)-glutamine methyltransferase [Accumulibacter sp.]